MRIIVIPTVDVEGVHGAHPFDQMILGNFGEKGSWGVFRLAQIFNEFGVRGTFFVDVYEYALWGERPMALVCERLAAMGQDVQLHTHPSWRDDPRDSNFLRCLKMERSYLPQKMDLMTKLSLEQQVELLEHGIELLHSWTGKKAIAHRSGGYAINKDTITALGRVGLLIDSSMNIAHPHSEIRWSANKVVYRDGILELPVTVMDYQFQISLFAKGYPLYSKMMKTDLDTCSLEELLYYIEAAQEIGLGFMNLFMHSYSLIKFDYYCRKFAPDPIAEMKLKAFLEYVTLNRNTDIMDCVSYHEYLKDKRNNLKMIDGVPQLKANMHISRLAINKVKHKTIHFVLRKKMLSPAHGDIN